jgi:hypothetical protein
VPEKFFVRRKIHRDVIINELRPLCKVPVILVIFLIKFSLRIFEIFSNIKFKENPSSGSERCFMRTDRETDMTKLITAFRNFLESA